MRSFKKLYESKRSYRICLFEGKDCRWPVIDGWTQKIINIGLDELGEPGNYTINYLNDKKDFIVTFFIEQNKYFIDEFKADWIMRVWGKKEEGNIDSLKKIKSVLKKLETLYEKAKSEGKKKIPSFLEWKKIVNDYEIAYSRKQNNRTVVVKIMSIHGFIKNLFIAFGVGVYNDSMNDRVTEKEFYIDSKRSEFKKEISVLNDKFFKK